MGNIPAGSGNGWNRQKVAKAGHWNFAAERLNIAKTVIPFGDYRD